VVIKCLGYGGAEQLLVDLLATADREQFEYEVAYVLEAEDALVPAVVAGGTPVHSLGASGNRDLRWMPRLHRLVRHGGYDIVHFHLPYTAALGRLMVALTPKAIRPAIVYTEHSPWDRMALALRALNRAAIGLDGSLIVISEAGYRSLPRTLKPRARVIVHGIDLHRADHLLDRRADTRAAVRDGLGVSDGELLLLTVANLRLEKAYDVLLDSVRVLADRGIPFTLVAVGRGPFEQELREQHRRLELNGRFVFLGPRHDVLELMVASDVFVLASRQEGLPVVLMEATSLGMPIVATAVGAVPLVLTDGVDGLIVPPERPTALADAIERLATDPGLRSRLGAGAKTRSSMFDLSAANREIEDIYRELADRTG
jgi:glycosyltransferase involved in cell wall biosynthesis